MAQLILTDRLRAIAGQIRDRDFCVADIGTDHGYVPIWLMQNGHRGHVILSDVNEGPLRKAAESFQKYMPDAVPDMRHGAGLSVLKEGEADALVIAGMGGNLTIDILSDGSEIAESVSEIVVQPTRHVNRFRRWLREGSILKGFSAVMQIPVREGRRFGEIIVLLENNLLNPHDIEFIRKCRETEDSAGINADIKREIFDEVPAMFIEAHNYDNTLYPGMDVKGFIEFKTVLENIILKNIEENGKSADAEYRMKKARERIEGFRILRGMLKG